jgi:hypothetical protein
MVLHRTSRYPHFAICRSKSVQLLIRPNDDAAVSHLTNVNTNILKSAAMPYLQSAGLLHLKCTAVLRRFL